MRETFDHMLEDTRRDGEIGERMFRTVQLDPKSFVGVVIVVLTSHVREGFCEVGEGFLVQTVGAKLLDRLSRVIAQLVVVPVGACNTDDRYAELALPLQLVERR
jgi:hypothetical protein